MAQETATKPTWLFSCGYHNVPACVDVYVFTLTYSFMSISIYICLILISFIYILDEYIVRMPTHMHSYIYTYMFMYRFLSIVHPHMKLWVFFIIC